MITPFEMYLLLKLDAIYQATGTMGLVGFLLLGGVWIYCGDGLH